MWLFYYISYFYNFNGLILFGITIIFVKALHELGHAYGLPHPPGCDQSLPKCDSNALKWSGFYYGFPDNSYLREDEKSILISGNYVQSIVDAIFNSGFEN